MFSAQKVIINNYIKEEKRIAKKQVNTVNFLNFY